MDQIKMDFKCWVFICLSKMIDSLLKDWYAKLFWHCIENCGFLAGSSAAQLIES